MSNSNQDPSTSKDIFELKLPIVIRKGHIFTTRYPLVNFVSFDDLSHTFHTFAMSLLVMSLLKDCKETLAHPSWWLAMEEEMKVFMIAVHESYKHF